MYFSCSSLVIVTVGDQRILFDCPRAIATSVDCSKISQIQPVYKSPYGLIINGSYLLQLKLSYRITKENNQTSQILNQSHLGFNRIKI